MTLTLHLIRHGQTLFNRREVVQGWVDSPLTERGWAQAEAAAGYLAARPLTAVYASTSERAWDTAERVALRHPGLLVQLRRELKEMHFGDLEARPNEEFFDAVGDPRQYFSGVVRGVGEQVAGGERPGDYAARVTRAVEEIVDAHPAGEVAVVSHGITIATILTLAGSEAIHPIVNGSVSTLRVHPEHGWTVDAVGVWEFPPGP